MKTLRRICEHFSEEIEGVVEYVGDSETVKAKHPELSKAYLEMAKAEYQHAATLLAQYKACCEHVMEDDVSPYLKEMLEDKQAHMMRELAKAKSYLEVYGGK